MRTTFLLFITFGIIGLNIGCDSLPGIEKWQGESPVLENFTVNPNEITFHPINDGQKDTTLSMILKVDAFNLGDNLPHYYIFKNSDEDPSYTGQFKDNGLQNNGFEANVELNTNTYSFLEYKILITAEENHKSADTYIIGTVKQTGIALAPPEIIETNAPITVKIPTNNDVIVARFTAKVKVDGQNNIDNVYLNFRNADGTLLSAQPYAMMDDGETDVSGDLVAGDNIYTKSFSIDKSNTPSERTALYWAIDKAGTSSDTLKVSFNIVE